ncbi:MASE1 domain-containing protein [Oleiagrimonas sp.]|uniref:MASE1 domain-containing protein n=1 Tax=Oleiagrimonas sp. TaxID=2010330 RepID=UPI00262176A4|nr:MASE1 domain-containing protein [Oleiagrimonas sp.]MDA3914027.1 MASE1 domain-containing protein [Oleiagrimonas sp.]
MPLRTRGPVLGTAYFAIWLLLLTYAEPNWLVFPGLRFSVLMLVRPRYWPWLIASEWLADIQHLTSLYGMSLETLDFLLGQAPHVLLVAGLVLVLRRFGLKASLRTPEDVARLLAAALLVAFANTLVSWGLNKLLHPMQALGGIGGAIGGELMHEYLGCLLIAPLLIMLTRDFPERRDIVRTMLETLLVLLPSLALLLVMLQSSPPLPGFARILSLAPVLLFAFRNGWRGAIFSMLVVNCGMMLFTQVDLHHPPSSESLLFLAVAGTGAMVLGSASDALRRSSRRLAVQNARLEGANRRLDHLARQLSDAARRNLRTEEHQRRHVAAELHDELGQNLTAIQTRVKLAQTRLREAGLADVETSINDILAHMRAAVRRLLNSLRPTVLDEFGLARALEEGPIRDLLKTAGIEYSVELQGNLRDLDEDTRTTVYRVVQEAATNTVRHAMAENFALRLRSGIRQSGRVVLIDLRDDGIGLGIHPHDQRSGHGLQSMRDRVTALGGIFRIYPVARGTRLRILLPASTSNH